jgi:hypothetical protein
MSSTEQEWNRDKREFATEEQPSPGGPLAHQFAELTRKLLDVTTVAGALRQIVITAHEIIPNADVVSVTLRGPSGVFHTPVETDPIAAELDQLQYDHGEGPCVDAARKRGPAAGRSADLAMEPSWPKFGPAAAARGYNSVLSTALLPNAKPPRLSGALNLYSRERDGLSDADGDTALLLATHGSLALAHTQALTNADLQAVHLRKAIDSRDVIGQAKGILMQRRGISAEQAFEVLRRTSQSMNVKLTELASTLATRHTDLDKL